MIRVGLSPSDIKDYIKATLTKTSWHQFMDRKIDQCNIKKANKTYMHI